MAVKISVFLLLLNLAQGKKESIDINSLIYLFIHLFTHLFNLSVYFYF